MGELSGRLILVTGASSGIGAAVAQELASAGAELLLQARNAARLDEVSRSLALSPRVILGDLERADGAQDVVSQVASHGVPHAIICNAGVFSLGALGALSLAEAHRMFDVNIRSTYDLLHAVVPGMRSRGTGHVVLIGSIADHAVFPENAAYAASKHAERAMLEALRTETRGSGIRVTLISPGPVDTPIWDPIAPETRPGFPTREQMLRPEDVARAVSWCLAQPAHVNVDMVRLSAS